MEYISIFCQVIGLGKLISAAFGWHFADPLFEVLGNVCAFVAVPATSVQLATSEKFVK